MKNSFLLILSSFVIYAFLMAAVPDPILEEKYPDSLPVLAQLSGSMSAIKGSGAILNSPEAVIYGISNEPVQVAQSKAGCEPRNVVKSGYFKLNSTYHWAIVTIQYPGPACQWRYTYNNCSAP